VRNAFALTLLLATFAPAAHAQQPTVHFLSREQARAALTQGAERSYYERLQLAEMRAKSGLPLQNLTLQAARDQVREAYGAAAEDFTADEQAALREAIEVLQPILQAQAPLYARTPWSFIKVRSNIEGGLSHTRGDSIVLSETVAQSLAAAHLREPFDKPSAVWALLVHEQTHVLQRRDPALFEGLYKNAFGFVRMTNLAAPAWLTERRVINPDAPEVAWAFPLKLGAQRRWIVPDVALEVTAHPRMPLDFLLIALPVTRHGDAWAFADQQRPAAYQNLMSLDEYVQAFPDTSEIFHPNEICASMLSSLLLDHVTSNPTHPLWLKTKSWADKALQ
jgi:hypothetical protein